jgi:DNA replication protein DnaC
MRSLEKSPWQARSPSGHGSFDVIATAYERNSLVVTTNLPFENLTEVLGSERLTGAALDRLTHRCHILETKGESYRLQDAKRRRRRAD